MPVAGAFLLPLFGWISPKLRNFLALAFVACSFLCSLALLPHVLAGKVLIINKQLMPGFNCLFIADNLAVFMALVSSLISSIIVLYSFGYISHYENQNEYYFLVVLFLGAMMGLVFSGNLIFLYIFWEITAITSWRLIGFFREKMQVLRADKSFLVTVFGALLMLIGFVSIFQLAGSFDLPVIKEYFKVNSISVLASLLILAGIFAKSATLPFHTWLPDAGVAPSPVTALLHAAVLVKIGVYVFARLFIVNFIAPDIVYKIVLATAAASAIVAGGAALIETDLKRIIAYSTISQIGFIFFGFAVGNEMAVAGALLFILMHGLAKAGLFLCAGIVEQNTKNKDITKMGGLIRTMPITAVSFLFCAFSVMGVPPMGGFFSKYMVFSGAILQGNLFISFTYMAAATLTILYLFRTFNIVFMGEPAQGSNPAAEGSAVMLVCVASLAILSLAAGMLIYYPGIFSRISAIQMLGIVK